MNLKQTLKENNIMHQEFADHCGVSLATVGRWVSKNAFPLYVLHSLKVLISKQRNFDYELKWNHE